MNKLIGHKKIDTAIFISGKGSNLKNLYKFSKLKISPINISLVISNNRNAKGLLFAKSKKIEKKVYNFKKDKNCEKKILNDLKKKKINFICLAGFMKILSKGFIKRFNGKIINIHPSLLPKYKGLNTHKRVINNNEKYTGCTVHYVNKSLDAGKIILQKKVRITKKDTIRSIKKKVIKIEHEIYPLAIEKVLINP